MIENVIQVGISSMKTPFCNKYRDRDGMIIDEKDTKNDPF